MKVHIDKNGNLSLEKRGIMKVQYCPYNADESCECGEWCPMFSVYKSKESVLLEDKRVYMIHIDICNDVSIACKESDYSEDAPNG